MNFARQQQCQEFSLLKYMSGHPSAAVLVFLGVVTAPLAAQGQGLESLGNRASALAAFVAVADDASAVAWNPSGLVSGPIFNILLDTGRSTSTPNDPPRFPGSARKLGTTLVAIGTLPMGLAYYRLATSAAAAGPAVGGTADREASRDIVVRTMVTNHFGATVQQSVGDYVTLGASIKLVRGSVAGGESPQPTWGAAFEALEDLESEGSFAGDVDLGAMFAAGRLRAGLVVRNVTEPTFGDGAEGGVEIPLERHARLGVAWGDSWSGLSRLIVAVDADVTRVPHPAGDRRDIAAGVERWVRDRQIAVRGGVRASTVGDARPVVSGGASYAVRAGTYVDAYVSGGSGDVRGWGVAARMTY